MVKTKQTARKSTGGKLPRKSHAVTKTSTNYDSMTISELKKLIPADKIVSSRQGKPPLKADIIESIKNNKESKSKESKSKESKESKESKSKESKSKESKSKGSSKSKKKTSKKSSKQGMVVLIWTKESYEYNPDIGGQSNVYFSGTPYFGSGTSEQITASSDALLKIFRYHLKNMKDTTTYSDEDLIREVISNPSTRLRFNDNLCYFEVTEATHV